MMGVSRVVVRLHQSHLAHWPVCVTVSFEIDIDGGSGRRRRRRYLFQLFSLSLDCFKWQRLPFSFSVLEVSFLQRLCRFPIFFCFVRR